MIMFGWLIFFAGALVGVVATNAWHAGVSQMRKDTHKKEMDEAFEEIKRCRAQVAMLVGK
jgi:hypothetical protein